MKKRHVEECSEASTCWEEVGTPLRTSLPTRQLIFQAINEGKTKLVHVLMGNDARIIEIDVPPLVRRIRKQGGSHQWCNVSIERHRQHPTFFERSLYVVVNFWCARDLCRNLLWILAIIRCDLRWSLGKKIWSCAALQGAVGLEMRFLGTSFFKPKFGMIVDLSSMPLARLAWWAHRGHKWQAEDIINTQEIQVSSSPPPTHIVELDIVEINERNNQSWVMHEIRVSGLPEDWARSGNVRGRRNLQAWDWLGLTCLFNNQERDPGEEGESCHTFHLHWRSKDQNQGQECSTQVFGCT